MNIVRTAILMTLAAIVLISGSGCGSKADFDSRLDSITDPYEFNTAKWEAGALLSGAKQALFDRPAAAAGKSEIVSSYFATVRRIQTLNSQIGMVQSGARTGDASALHTEAAGLTRQTSSSTLLVKTVIKRQVAETLAEQGIFNPVLNINVQFPPVNFAMEQPPHVMIISPRDHIQEIRSVILRQELTQAQIDAMEAAADKLGVSSLVLEIGGFAGTFPSFVADQADLQYTIETVAHEWLHQYLAFKPLGFAYVLDVLGISRNRDIATINESVANIFGREIASIIYRKYYAPPEAARPAAPRDTTFNSDMRQIRATTDQYLAQGKIDEAEAYMEQARLGLAAKGYYIRKLNQAYFAFYGTYGDNPASVSPAGSQLRSLRAREKTLKDFLDTISTVTSKQGLTDLLK